MHLGETANSYPRPVAGAVERLLHNGISGPEAIPCSTTCTRSSRARSSGRPGSRVRSCSAPAAGTSCSSPARTSGSATRTTTAK
jgi:hypothetical protein